MEALDSRLDDPRRPRPHRPLSQTANTSCGDVACVHADARQILFMPAAAGPPLAVGEIQFVVDEW